MDMTRAIMLGAILHAAALSAGMWRNAGPGGGGWVQSILASRHDAQRMFVGCDVAGVFRSDDGGRSYEAHNSGFEHIWVSTIAEHPTNPSVVFIGSQGGIYKSTDGGLTWNEKRAGLPKVKQYGHSIEICKFAFDPANPDVMFAAEGNPRQGKGGTGVVWKSVDGGESWKPVGSFPEKTYCWDISVNPSDGSRIIISTSRGLFRSEDGGTSWAESNGGLPAHRRTRMLARGTDRPDILYVTLKAAGGETPWAAGVYRSEDGGQTWSPRNGGLEQLTGAQGEGAHKASWYDCVAVDPRNADVAYAAGASWVCDKTWKTTDGGQTWNPIFRCEDQRGWCNFWGPWVTTLSISAKFPDTLAFGTAGAVYRTEDGGRTWSQRYTEARTDRRIGSTGLELTCMFDIVPDRTRKGRHFFCYADIGLFLTEDDGRTLERVMTGTWGDCFTLRPSPDDPGLVWGAFGAKGAKSWHRICESRDGGRSWNALTDATEPWAGCWAARLQCMTKEPPYRLAYLAPGHGIAVGEDGGRKWSLVGTNDFPNARRISALLARGRTFLVGLGATDDEDGSVWASSDLGRTWRRLTDDGLKIGSIKDIAAKDGRIMIGAREQWSGRGRGMRLGGVWLSPDAGKTWRRVLDNPFCQAVEFAGKRLVVGLNDQPFHDHCVAKGVMTSSDGGASWVNLSDDSLKNRNITCLAVDPFDENAVWAGTGGNSAFRTVLP